MEAFFQYSDLPNDKIAFQYLIVNCVKETTQRDTLFAWDSFVMCCLKYLSENHTWKHAQYFLDTVIQFGNFCYIFSILLF